MTRFPRLAGALIDTEYGGGSSSSIGVWDSRWVIVGDVVAVPVLALAPVSRGAREFSKFSSPDSLGSGISCLTPDIVFIGIL